MRFLIKNGKNLCTPFLTPSATSTHKSLPLPLQNLLRPLLNLPLITPAPWANNTACPLMYLVGTAFSLVFPPYHGINVTFAVVYFLHQASGCITNLQRNRLCRQLPHICLTGFHCLIKCIGFGCRGKIDHGVCQMYVTLRHSQKMARLICRNCHLQGV